MQIIDNVNAYLNIKCFVKSTNSALLKSYSELQNHAEYSAY